MVLSVLDAMGFDVVVLLNCHGISRWPMPGPSVKDRKPAQGVSLYIILDVGGSTMTQKIFPF